MNIFYNSDFLFSNDCLTSSKDSMDKFWNIATSLRDELGSNAKYLDKYLGGIFETISRLDVTTSVDIVENMCLDILSDCRLIHNVRPNNKKSQFYDLVKKYIDSNPIDSKNNDIVSEYYASKFIIGNSDILAQKYRQELSENVLFDLDFNSSQEMYKKISDIIGENRMEQLNKAIKETFMICPLMVLLSQQIVQSCVEMFLAHDTKSSKYVYQMLSHKENKN